MARKFMKNKFLVSRIATVLFGMTSAFTCLNPCVTYAAGSITIEKEFSTTDKNDTGKDNFDNTYKENGILYELTDIKTEIIDEQNVEADTYLFKTEPVGSEAELKEPDATITYDGKTYQLQSKKMVNSSNENSTRYVERTVSYTGVEGNADIPGLAEVVEKDPSGKEVSQYMPLINVVVEKESWDSTFEFPVRVSNYDADSFILNGTTIGKDEPLINYKDQFLEYLGLSSDYYRINSIEWSGSQYTSKGVVCRDAIAKGDKYVKDITATYGGEMVFNESSQYYYDCVYVNPDQPASTIYTIKSTATYTEVVKETEEIKEGEEPTEPEPSVPLVPETPKRGFFARMFDWIAENPIAALGIGTLAVVGVGILILFILAKKRKEEEGNKVEIVDLDDKKDRK